MDMSLLIVSFIFGTIGFGMFLYGKKAGRLIPLGAGMALMTIPYFIPNLIALIIVCLGLMVVPVAMRNA